ncbi:MAG: amidohydrolase [Bacteroidales bacterium]|nr:amidohydrolase [Bacteroidales bacterium]
MTSSILLRDVTLGGDRKDILIGQGRIRRIGPVGACADWEIAGNLDMMDCSGMVAIPGLINMHTHSPMALMRGIGEDMLFHQWLDKIWKVEEHLDHDFVYWGTKVACLEMIRTGTTTFNDQYWFFDSSVKAAREMGMRIATGYDVMDKGSHDEAVRQKEQCVAKSEAFLHAGDPGHIYELAFHAVYSVSEEMIVWTNELSARYDVPLHIHLCETRKEVEDCKAAHGGLTPVEYLDRLGVLSPRLLAAHTLWLTPHDIELLAQHGVHCIHNINSNTKLSSGYRFLYNEMRDAGINLCLGTDGCASSNNLDLLEAMKTSAIFQKAWREDPSALPLPELLAMATRNGARALRLDAGRIEEGAVADIVLVDTDNTFFLSPGPFLANLVYSAHSDCIDSVICDGRFLMRHREIPGEREILSEARKVLSKIA